MPTYITLKDVKKRWGKGQEDVFPVAQFEKLWGDMTALPELDCRFVVVPRDARAATQGAGATGRLAARRLGGVCGRAMRVGLIVLFSTLCSAQSYDVIVVGATSGGVAAAIAAGRQGMRVALIEETPTLGGVMSNGLSRTDGGPAECTGIYEEFRERCARYYLSKSVDDPAVKGLTKEQLGHRYEPHVADSVFKQMVAEVPSIKVFYNRYATKVLKQRNRVVGVVTRDREDSDEMTFRAAVTIDGTHEGDLLPLAGAKFRLGREPRTPEEPHAGAIYMTRGGDVFGSGEGDNKLQAFAMLLTIKDYGPGADKTIARPPGYDPKNYVPEPKYSTWWARGPLANGKFQLNENMDGTDVTEINWRWVNGSRAERRKIWEQYRDFTLGYVYFRQTVMGEKSIGLTEDEFPENQHFPYYLYVREGRRLEGMYMYNERDCIRVPGFPRPPLHKDSIAVGAWRIDSHAVSRDTEGYIYLGMEDRFKISAPHQAPFGILVPKEVDGLLVPMAVSATHVGFQVLRLEPIRVAMGQAAGNAAALCVKQKIQPREIRVSELQDMLLDQGQSLFYYKDVFASTPHFKAIERAAMDGIDLGHEDFSFKPEAKASRADAAKALFSGLNLKVKMDVSDLWKVMAWQGDSEVPNASVQYCTPDHWATYYLLTLYNMGAFSDDVLKSMNPDSPTTRGELVKWAASGLPASPSAKAVLAAEAAKPDGPVTRGELADFIIRVRVAGNGTAK